MRDRKIYKYIPFYTKIMQQEKLSRELIDKCDKMILRIRELEYKISKLELKDNTKEEKRDRFVDKNGLFNYQYYKNYTYDEEEDD